MRQNHALWLTIVALFLVSLACNAFAGDVEPALPPPPTLAAGLGTAVAPPPISLTTEGGLAPTVTLPGVGEGTTTPDFPALRAISDVNVRTGPGTNYQVVTVLRKDDVARVIGTEPASGWWLIECPPRATVESCWVTGRTDLVAVTQSEGVPIATAPPTPTPTPRPLGPMLAYLDNGRLLILSLDLSQTPVTAAPPVVLVEDVNLLDLHISPDGRRIAYRLRSGFGNELHVINVDGSGSQLLLRAADLPISGGQGSSFSVWINQVEWRDAQTLLFNTELRNSVDPGVNQEDLWQVGLNGEPAQLFTPGSGAGYFTISATGQALLSRSNAIWRLTGSNSDAPIPAFTPISVSNGRYYPQPQWSADGRRALVAIPAPDAARADLWQIPTTGQAFPLGSLEGYTLTAPARWSPDGNRMAHVRQAPGETPTLFTAGTGGQDLSPIQSGAGLLLWDWAADSNRFLYSGPGFYAVAQIGQGPITYPLAAGAQLGGARWLTTDTYVLAVGSGVNWSLISGAVDGRATPLQPIGGAPPQFAVWLP